MCFTTLPYSNEGGPHALIDWKPCCPSNEQHMAGPFGLLHLHQCTTQKKPLNLQKVVEPDLVAHHTFIQRCAMDIE